MADRIERPGGAFRPGLPRPDRRAAHPDPRRPCKPWTRTWSAGPLNGGTTAVHQQLLFRPVPGTGRPETPVQRLYLASAAAHPGGGVHGACGANAARAALRAHRPGPPPAPWPAPQRRLSGAPPPEPARPRTNETGTRRHHGQRHQLVKCSATAGVARCWPTATATRRWVVGTQKILRVDAAWPAVDAELPFRAGIGPIHFKDSCVVRICEPQLRLELEAMAEPFGTARIAFTLIPWSDNTLVILDEHPLLGPGARLQGPISERLLHLRNRRLLSNLARAAVSSRGAASHG